MDIFAVSDTQAETFAKCVSSEAAIAMSLWLESPEQWENNTRAAKRLRTRNKQVYCMGFLAYMLEQNRLGFVEFISESSGVFRQHNQCDITVSEAIRYHYDPFACSMVSNTSGLKELSKYIQGSMGPFLDAYVEFGGIRYEDVCENHEVECQGLRETAKAMIAWVPTVFTKGIDWTVDTIISSIRRHFTQVLEKFCPMAANVCGWITGIWEKVKSWTDQAWQYLGCCFEVFSEVLEVGIAILAVTLALNVVEQIMLMCGLLPCVVGIGAIFCKGAMAAVLTLELATRSELIPRFVNMVQVITSNYAAAMASVFVDQFESGDERAEETRSNLPQEAQQYVDAYMCRKQDAINVRKEQEWIAEQEARLLQENADKLEQGRRTSQKLQDWSDDQYARAVDKQVAKAQFSPLILLEIIADALKQFASGGLIGMGRTMNAISQINNGIKSVKELAGRIMQILADIIFNVFGLEATLLHDASILLADDLSGWLEEIQDIEQQFFLKAYCNQNEVCTMHALRKRGADMQKTILASGRKFSPPVVSVLNQGLKKLEKLIQECAIKGAPIARKIPFCVFFQGTSRVGKSLLMGKVVKMVQNQLKIPADQIYSRNCVDEYWSGYRRQAVVVYDDFGAVQMQPGVEAEFIPLVSSAPLPLNMASLHEKGMFFDSQVIVASTNFLEPAPESQIRDKDAFRNRRHLLIQVELREDVPYNPSDFTQNQRYRLLRHTTMGDYRTIREFDTYEDLHVFILNRWQEHDREQELNLNSENCFEIGEGQPMLEMQRLIELSSAMNAFMPSLHHEIDQQVYDHFLSFTHLGKVRRVWWKPESKETVEFPRNEEYGFYDKELERSKLFATTIYEFLKLNEETNIVIKNNLHELACADVWDKDFNFVGQIGKPAYNALLLPEIQAMPKWQRMALCCIGTHFDRRKKQGFFHRMSEKLKSCLLSLYKEEYKDWPVCVKILVGLAFSALAAVGIWKVFEMLRAAVGGRAIIGAAATAFATSDIAEPQSKKPNRYDVSSYKYRNVPLRQRAWAQAQMSIDQSHVMLMDKVMATFSYGMVKAQVVMVPGRRFIWYAHAARAIKNPIYGKISTSGREYTFLYNPANCVDIEGSELCVYESDQIEDIPSASWDLFAWDAEAELPEVFKANLFSCKWQTESASYLNECAEVVAKVEKKGLTVQEGNYRRDVPIVLAYDGATVNSDCGSILVYKAGSKLKVAGIHVAGGKGKGYACLMPPLRPKAQAQSAQEHFEIFPYEQETNAGLALVGELKQGIYVSCPTKTSFERTPESYHLGLPCEKEPSILSSHDPRIPEHVEGYCPFRAGIQKYANPMGHLDHDLMYEVAHDMQESWHDCVQDFTFPEVDLETAINGIDMVEYMECIPKSTSEGFPHVLSRAPGEKGKMRFLEGDGEKFSLREGTSVKKAYDLLQEEIDRSVPTLVAIECPKDEKLPLRKIYTSPKTRCFSILPMEYNLLVRQKFLHFVRFMMKRRDVLPSQVGVNPYSLEWGAIARRLQEVGNSILCCDYSSFDGLMSSQVMSCIADTMNDFMGGDVCLKRQRKNLLMACCSRFSVVKGNVWRVEGGIPSGFPLTVVMNGIFNELLVRYCFKKIMREQGATPLECSAFDSYIRFVVYGDDNLISVSPVIHDKFNGKLLKECMAQFGVTITDGKDKTLPTLEFRPLEDCDFLKRGFIQRSELVWDAPEERSSLYTQLHYVSTKMQSLEDAYTGNLVNVIRELYMHSPKEASDLRRKALRDLPWLSRSKIGTMENVQAFYAMQRAGYRMDESIDVICDLAKLGKYVKGEACKEIVWLTPTVGACDLRYFDWQNAKVDEFWVLCQTNYHEFDENRVMQLCWTPGSGRGGLPTAHWLRTCMLLEKGNVRKKLHWAMAEKKKIIFCAKGGVLIPTVMAGIFLSKEDPMLNLAGVSTLTCAMESVKTLGFLKEGNLNLF
uniref:RNA1 polyprotein n=1 Tax=Andean potato mottle virus TaxID=12259 RepID=A0A8F8N1P9_APMV|nr:polyprotein 1 [Andean potato mottle virus]